MVDLTSEGATVDPTEVAVALAFLALPLFCALVYIRIRKRSL